jgi:hypothetical protein
MTKQTITAVFFSIVASLVTTVTAQAGNIVNQTLSPYYDSPDGYDFVNTFPAPGSTTIGTFTFSIPVNVQVGGATISGTFGNGDSDTTALSDYYLGFTGDETAVEVASCDSILADCYSSQNGPTAWTYTLTTADLTTLGTAIENGSLDFTYTWGNNTQFAFANDPQYVYAGAATLDIVTPEPATLLICFGGLAGIAAARRFRKI